MGVFLDNIDLNSQSKVVNSTAPTAASDLATKAYVDSAAGGATNPKNSVVVVSTTNVALSGLLTIDGTTLSSGQRVLLTGQTSTAQNGIWLAASGSWTRPSDFASGSAQQGAFVFVETGTVNGSSGWVAVGATTITVDTTNHTWTQFSGAGEITAGTGLLKSGNTLSIETGGITVAHGGTGANNAASARANLGAVGKYAANIGDGSSTSITVNHALNVTDVLVQVFTTGAPPAKVDANVTVTDANNVVVVFAVAPASNAYRCVVIG